MQKTGHRGLCNLRDVLVPSDPSAVVYLWLCLKPPSTIDGVSKTHLLWSQPPGSPSRCAKAATPISMPMVWGGSFIKLHSWKAGEFNPTWFSSLPKAKLCVLCAEKMDFSLGVLNISVIITLITWEDLIPELSLPFPYKHTLSTLSAFYSMHFP